MTDKYTTAEYQQAVGDFVRREVIYCVSHLISELAKREVEDESEYYEEIMSVLVRDDWQSAAEDAGWREATDKDGDPCYATDPSDPSTCDWYGDWRELCEAKGIDPYQHEAYEHWIVTDWLANKLEQHGEMVSKDIFGLTVWGRCTTGQAISMDRVICDIYDELHGEG